jgi:ABC-3C biological conflict system middle component
MMDVLFEQRIIQNTGLGAEAIWQAVYEAYESSGRMEGVSFPLVFLVLPLTFHRRTASVLASKKKPGAIYKALEEDREIPVGLQERMEALSERTFQSLSIGFSTGLLKLDQNNGHQIFPGRKSLPVKHVTDEVKKILMAAKRVGQTFAELTIVQVAKQLGIRF